MRFDEDNAVAIITTVAFDRVEELTKKNSRLEANAKQIEDVSLSLASARGLLSKILTELDMMESAGYRDMIGSTIRAELRSS